MVNLSAPKIQFVWIFLHFPLVGTEIVKLSPHTPPWLNALRNHGVLELPSSADLPLDVLVYRSPEENDVPDSWSNLRTLFLSSERSLSSGILAKARQTARGNWCFWINASNTERERVHFWRWNCGPLGPLFFPFPGWQLRLCSNQFSFLHGLGLDGVGRRGAFSEIPSCFL